MPYLPTTQAWLAQSALLLEARPTTTRITTKYTLSKPSSKPRSHKATKSEPAAALPGTDPSPTPTPASTQAPPTRATLTLKTYDPISGVTLKYKTDKAAEVGRLISSLARLGRSMAGLPEKEDAVMLDAQTVEGGTLEVASGSGVATPVPEGTLKAPTAAAGPQGGGGQGGKKGKKKGKK